MITNEGGTPWRPLAGSFMATCPLWSRMPYTPQEKTNRDQGVVKPGVSRCAGGGAEFIRVRIIRWRPLSATGLSRSLALHRMCFPGWRLIDVRGFLLLGMIWLAGVLAAQRIPSKLRSGVRNVRRPMPPLDPRAAVVGEPGPGSGRHARGCGVHRLGIPGAKSSARRRLRGGDALVVLGSTTDQYISWSCGGPGA